MTDVITNPKRSTIEELFPVTADYQMDRRARLELRTTMEFWRLAKRILDQSFDLVKDPPPPFHLNTINTAYLKTLPEGAKLPVDIQTRLSDWRTESLKQASDVDMLYYMQSLYFMSIQANVGRVVQGTSVYASSENVNIIKILPQFVGELAIVGHALRKYPFIRFDIFTYVNFVAHYQEDVDAEGVPRVSIDGYLNV